MQEEKEIDYVATITKLQQELIEEKQDKSTSPSIGKLAEAMSKAQGAIEGAKKDTTNPHFKMKYADLASCWDACRKALSDNDLAVIQITTDTAPPFVTIETILTHKSGEWIKGALTMKSVNSSKEKGIYDNPTPQGIGSTITYARRYALSAIVGLAPEDDDGNAGSGDQSDLEAGKKRVEEAKKKALANKKGGKAGTVKKKAEEKKEPEPGEDDLDADGDGPMPSVQQKLKDAIGLICNGEEKYFKDTLMECSKFTKDGDEHMMVDMKQIDDPKTNIVWLRATYGKAKKMIEKIEADSAK